MMSPARFQSITGGYSQLRIAVAGDFCLDRYLEIDPGRAETSIETGLPVHNVVKVRAQPGAAGTILNNLVALGIGRLYPIGFAGEDGEGYELCRALKQLPGVNLDFFLQTAERRTFTYCKPLVITANQPPVELNRLDTKNWTPTPTSLENRLIACLKQAAANVDAIIILDQVDVPQTGVITENFLQTVQTIARGRPDLLVLADSRRGLRDSRDISLKMNAAELAALTGAKGELTLEQVNSAASSLAQAQRRTVFVTLAAKGVVGASPQGSVEHVPALPVRGPIDIVGAGDAVTANLTAALVGKAGLREALEIASTAASVVIHKLGTTGTANVEEIKALLTMPG